MGQVLKGYQHLRDRTCLFCPLQSAPERDWGEGGKRGHLLNSGCHPPSPVEPSTWLSQTLPCGWGWGAVDREATRDQALGGATQVSSPHHCASPRGCVRASQFAPSVRGHLLTQNLEPSSPEPHRVSMRSGRGCEEGEHYRLPARDRPRDRLEPPPPRRSAPARPRKPFPQAL